jgi:hypothetical protein
MLLWQLHPQWWRRNDGLRLQFPLHRQFDRSVWGWQSPQHVLLRSNTSTRTRNRSKRRVMEIPRVLHVSRFLARSSSLPRSHPSSISDNNGGRTLSNQVAVSSNTIEACTSACYNAGYVFAGAEYSDECWCGTSIEAGGAPASASDCGMLCSGNSSEYCGGPNRLNLYNYTGTPPTTTTTSSGTGTVSLVTGLPGNWTYNGCWM